MIEFEVPQNGLPNGDSGFCPSESDFVVFNDGSNDQGELKRRSVASKRGNLDNFGEISLDEGMFIGENSGYIDPTEGHY